MEKLAKILDVSPEVIVKLENRLESVTGKSGLLDSLVKQNEELVKKQLLEMGVSRHANYAEVEDALLSKVEADDLILLKKIGHSGARGYEASQKVCGFVKKIHPPQSGFFLKKRKAQEFLLKEPPKGIMKALDYSRVEDLVEKEDLLEVYSALRFLEERQWQNEIFFKQYESLTPEDFEERPIEVRALSPKWAVAAELFVKKKYHNVSHLKELGVLFVIPIFLGISGETLRQLSLMFHYMYEIDYYSQVFKNYFAQQPDTFSKNLISTLRGDVINKRPVAGKNQQNFLVVQRYLAKEDLGDWRLFEPRINPEALHWQRAERDVVRIDQELAFWEGMDWAGDFFRINGKGEKLVSFDLVDMVMGLVDRREEAKYLYHHREALWNKIFIDYFGVEELEKSSKEHIVDGWFKV